MKQVRDFSLVWRSSQTGKMGQPPAKERQDLIPVWVQGMLMSREFSLALEERFKYLKIFSFLCKHPGLEAPASLSGSYCVDSTRSHSVQTLGLG